MKKTFKVALAATLALSTAQAARADLNINGAVGLPLNPTAQIPEPGGVRLQANYYDAGSVGVGDARFYGVFGAGRVGDNIEVSGGINRRETPGGFPIGDKTGFAIGAKYLITRESDPAGVRFAVGAGYDHALLKNVHVYGVASKYLGAVTGERVPLVGHLGIRYDRFDSGLVGGDSNKFSVFAGAEVPLSRTGDFQILGEVQSKNTEYAGAEVPSSIGLRYRPRRSPFGVTAGWQRQGIPADGGFFVQLGYTFGGGAAAATTGTGQ